MSFRPQQQAYSVAQGTSFTTAFLHETRDPTANDIGPPYPLYQGWVNTTTKAIWYLETLLSSAGVVTAQWRSVGPVVTNVNPPTSADYQYPLGQLWIVTEDSGSITAATQANPCVITSASHGLISTQQITISGVVGMTQLNGNTYTVTYLTSNTFSIGVDSTAYGAYISGGTWTTTDNDGYILINVAGTTAQWVKFVEGSAVAGILTINGIPPTADGNFTIEGAVPEQSSPFSVITAGTNKITLNPMSSARWIVDPLGASGINGTHTTIASALASATSGDTIFIMPGTYTENLTLKAGVNITAQVGDSFTPTVSIIGKMTATFSGTTTISNVLLQTNGDFFLAVTGSNATIVKLKLCVLKATNATGISYTTSSGSSVINLFECFGGIYAAATAFFVSSSAGTLSISYCTLENTGASTTASTISAGAILVSYSFIEFPITTSGTSALYSNHSTHITETNTTALTIGGSSGGGANQDTISSGTATPLSVTSSFDMNLNALGTSNATAVSGAGTVTLTGCAIQGSATSIIAPTTITPYIFQYGIGRSTTQPAFSAYLAADDPNVTGNGAVYTIGTNVAWTTLYNQGATAPFNTNGTFTAPITGKYSFYFSVLVGGITAAMTNGYAQIVAGGNTYQFSAVSPAASRSSSNYYSFQGAITIPLTAAQTAILQIVLLNGAGNTAGLIFGAAPVYSVTFSGKLEF